MIRSGLPGGAHGGVDISIDKVPVRRVFVQSYLRYLGKHFKLPSGEMTTTLQKDGRSEVTGEDEK